MSERQSPLNHPLLTAMSRRQLLKAGGALMTLLVSPVSLASNTRLLAVRVWPAQDYTRITLEGADTLRFSSRLLENPQRLVVDLEGLEFDSVLQSLPTKVTAADPYIQTLRAGRNRPGVVRLVIDLKVPVKPQVFTLPPIGNYGHRLVLDLLPVEPPDPLLALIQKTSPGAPAPASDPLADLINGSRKDKPEPGASTRPPATATRPTPAGSRPITIALDPGHGGEDPGAVGRGGTYEKNVTLAIARRLKARIDAEPGMRAMLTRDADFFVPLGQRVSKARRVQADLFVSIHADAFIRPEARGSSVFILSERGASSTAARWLASRENAADLIGGINVRTRDNHLARTLLDLSQTATLKDSNLLAKAVLTELGQVNVLHKRTVEQAGFAVLKAPDIPSILVETAFISNPEEEKKLADESYQDRMAEALFRGIRNYFAKNPPLARSKQAMASS